MARVANYNTPKRKWQALTLAGALMFVLFMPDAISKRLYSHRASTVASASSPAAALARVVQQYAKEQQQFCRDWAAGTPNPASTPADDTYLRVNVTSPVDSSKQFTMHIHKQDDIVSRHIGSSGVWEGPEVRAVVERSNEFRDVHSLSKEEVILFDIGSNIGWFAINAAVLGYKVLAFEPMLKNVGALRRTLCDNPELQERLTLVTKGLSDHDGRCKFFVHNTNQGNGIIDCSDGAGVKTLEFGKNIGDDGDYLLLEESSITTMDGFFKGALPALKDRVGVVKIDVEGFEPSVYAGSREFFKVVQPAYIMAEMNMQFGGRVGALQALQLYDELGYDIHLGSFQGQKLETTQFEQAAEETFKPGSLTNIYLKRRP